MNRVHQFLAPSIVPGNEDVEATGCDVDVGARTEVAVEFGSVFREEFFNQDEFGPPLRADLLAERNIAKLEGSDADIQCLGLGFVVAQRSGTASNPGGTDDEFLRPGPQRSALTCHTGSARLPPFPCL